MKFRKLLPPTFQRVERSTSPAIHNEILMNIEKIVHEYRHKKELEIENRIRELDYEWDTERTLEANFAAVVLLSAILSAVHHKKWLYLTGTASVFLLQHALQGWCPPLPVIRKLGIRTASEIYLEKMALINLLEEKRLNL